MKEFDFEDFKNYRQPLSEQFIEDNADRVSWWRISKHQKLTESFIEKYADRVDWEYISIYQKLTESFVEKYEDRVDWKYISQFQKLTESFIEKYEDRVDWGSISTYQKLTESFIEKYEDRVDWGRISTYQNLTESFIEKHEDRVDWRYISQFQKLTENFIFKHNLTIPTDSWLYADQNTKRKVIADCGFYEMDGDYVFAYKGIRSDNYSKYNFQYQYFVGNTYESTADFNLNNQNSFGLSAWTLDKAQEYCNEKIIKVKIHLDDAAALVHKESKLRCTRFEVLEEL